ncbi:MAG: NAD-dependent epimerase/dehydratase family protein, partial [Negativicutes bacterium]|nr:NAD-dependent epimerase/dehydratase family protein [Negativicutes bacterium]
AARYMEKVCCDWQRQTGSRVAILRLANVYGPRDRFAPGNANFIPGLIRRVCELESGQELEVWGSPDVVRDVIYAGDVAAAIVELLSAGFVGCEVFNLGGGIPVRVGQVVGLLLRLAGKDGVVVRYNRDRPATIDYRVLDCRRIGGKYGWQPRVDLADGLSRTLAWWKDNRHSWRR